MCFFERENIYLLISYKAKLIPKYRYCSTTFWLIKKKTYQGFQEEYFPNMKSINKTKSLTIHSNKKYANLRALERKRQQKPRTISF